MSEFLTAAQRIVLAEECAENAEQLLREMGEVIAAADETDPLAQQLRGIVFQMFLRRAGIRVEREEEERIRAEKAEARVAELESALSAEWEQVGWCWPPLHSDADPTFCFSERHLCADGTEFPVFRRVEGDK